MTDQPEIKPCPWCGDAPGDHLGFKKGPRFIANAAGARFAVYCDTCKTQGPTKEPGYEAIAAWNEVAGAQKILKDMAVALSSLNSVMVFHVRDWSATSRDAWLWGVLVGWNEDSYQELPEKFPRWGADAIPRLKQLRAAVAAVYDPDRDGDLHTTRPDGRGDD